MIRKLGGNFFCLVSVLMLVATDVSQPAEAESFTLQGEVKVFKKGGKRILKRFDNAVVYLEGVSTPAPAEPVAIDQRKKKFLPRICPVIKGQVVRFYNMDKVEHNVFSTDKKNTFDLGRYPKEHYRDQVYDKLGLYKVYCNIHKAMILDLLVVPNKYYTLTDKRGQYKIANIPAGDYVLKALHIYGGSAELPVAVKNNVIMPTLTLNSTRVVRELRNHLNKYGKKYKKRAGNYRR